jgi:TRAP-type C4-dicarboxylate transport system substrate-binding protein
MGSTRDDLASAERPNFLKLAGTGGFAAATAYVLGVSRSYTIMQLDLKENIQNATNGKVYVKLAPGGQLGAGGDPVQKVQAGTIQAAQHSLSNSAPFASAVGLVNLPYSCGSNQRFTDLGSSAEW